MVEGIPLGRAGTNVGEAGSVTLVQVCQVGSASPSV